MPLPSSIFSFSRGDTSTSAARENTLCARRANCIGSVGLQLLAVAMADPLRFLELPSAPDVSFWARLAELKLNEYKLSEDPIPCVGHYRACAHEGLASPLTLTSASFDLDTTYEVRSIAKTLFRPATRKSTCLQGSLNLFWMLVCPSCALAGEQSQIRMEGEVVLLNTLESMKTFDRKGAALGAIRKVEASVQSGTCLSDPTALNRFVMVCFADLKQYTFYYWVCVPAAKTVDPILSEGFTQGVDQAACEACQEYYHSETKGRAPFWVLEGGEEGGYRCRPIDNGGEDDDIATVAFVDPSHVAGSPGWPLRNFLWLLCGGLCGLRRVRVLCLRHEKLGRFSASRSAWHEVAIPPAGSDTTVNAVGWEHNSKGKLSVSLYTSYTRIADQHLA